MDFTPPTTFAPQLDAPFAASLELLGEVPEERPVVLHVTECYDGGVRSVVDQVAASVPTAEHHLLYGGGPQPGPQAGYASVHRIRGGRLAARRDYTSALRRVRPTVVHAHSSWAGLTVRGFTGPRVPVVYQPHCFAFEDGERALWFRLATRSVERALTGRTDVVVAVSEHERRLSVDVVGHRRAVLVPNVPSVRRGPSTAPGAAPGPESPAVRPRGGAPHVVMLGRVCAQKDPAWFAEAARRTAAQVPGARFTWVGDGEPAATVVLAAAGVHVTGWLTGEPLERVLDSADVYLHSARYEGFPVAVLDAASRDLPVLVRPIHAFDGTGLARVSTPAQVPDAVVRLHRDEAHRAAALAQGRRVLEAMDGVLAARRLEELYAGMRAAPARRAAARPVGR